VIPGNWSRLGSATRDLQIELLPNSDPKSNWQITNEFVYSSACNCTTFDAHTDHYQGYYYYPSLEFLLMGPPLTATPEPGTLALVGFGVAGVATRLLRGRR